MKKTYIFLFTLLLLTEINCFAQQQKDSISFHVANVHQIQLHYAKSGKGSTLIIFLHGFPECWYAYKNILDGFIGDERFTAIAPDLRGYNLSSKPDSLEAYTLPVLAEDIIELAKTFPSQKFILVGHDWGGLIGWYIAQKHPEYLSKLIIINAPYPPIFYREIHNNPQQQKASNYIHRLTKKSASFYLTVFDHAVLQKIVFGKKQDTVFYTAQTKKIYQAAWKQPKAVKSSLYYYKANAYTTGIFTEQPAPINVPVLVLWGMKDEYLVPQNLNGLEQYITNLTIKQFPDASHWVIHEKPKDIFNEIYPFVSH